MQGHSSTRARPHTSTLRARGECGAAGARRTRGEGAEAAPDKQEGEVVRGAIRMHGEELQHNTTQEAFIRIHVSARQSTPYHTTLHYCFVVEGFFTPRVRRPQMSPPPPEGAVRCPDSTYRYFCLGQA